MPIQCTVDWRRLNTQNSQCKDWPVWNQNTPISNSDMCSRFGLPLTIQILFKPGSTTTDHGDWDCTNCSDFGFLFLTLFTKSVHVHEFTNLCARTHTHTHTHTHTYRLGLYHLHCFYEAYMCMNVHTCAQTRHTQTGLAVTLFS